VNELSALYAFLVERAGVKSVGLFWPAPNHTAAVSVVRPTTGAVVRVVVPTSQIFLGETDRFDTKKFDPWRQKTIYEYTRRDIPDTYELPLPFLSISSSRWTSMGGFRRDAATIAVFARRRLSANVDTGTGSSQALKRRSALEFGSAEDLAALQNLRRTCTLGCPLDSERRCRLSRALLNLKVSQASTVCRQLRQFQRQRHRSAFHRLVPRWLLKAVS